MLRVHEEGLAIVAGAVNLTSSSRVLVQADVMRDLLRWSTMLAQIGLVAQNLAQQLGGACGSRPLLQIVVLVIALVVIDTGSDLTVVIVDDSTLFSTQ